MHKTAPGVDWRKIDDSTRRQKHLINTRLREQYYKSHNGASSPNRTIFSEREITGTWVEKGSNNLAGRIHTAEIDVESGFIYCGSSGGNIWKGTLNGDNWQSLNDYFKIPGMTLLRWVDTDTDRRLLIGAGNTMYTTG